MRTVSAKALASCARHLSVALELCARILEEDAAKGTPERVDDISTFARIRANTAVWHAATTVARSYQLSVDQVLSRRRYKRVVVARHVLWAVLCRRGMTAYEIAELFGYDPTTVRSAVDGVNTSPEQFARSKALAVEVVP